MISRQTPVHFTPELLWRQLWAVGISWVLGDTLSRKTKAASEPLSAIGSLRVVCYYIVYVRRRGRLCRLTAALFENYSKYVGRDEDGGSACVFLRKTTLSSSEGLSHRKVQGT